MAETYKPGDKVPKTGRVKCTQHPNVTDNVTAGSTLAPCDHWGDAGQKNCTCEYV